MQCTQDTNDKDVTHKHHMIMVTIKKMMIEWARIRLVARQQMNNQSFSSTATPILTNLILIDHDHIDDNHDPQCDDDGDDNKSGINHETSMSQT